MQSEIQLKFNEIDSIIKILKKHLNWDISINRIIELNQLIEKPDFWNDASKAQSIMRDKTNLEKTIESIKNIENEKINLFELIGLAEEENDKSFLNETISNIDSLVVKCEKLQIESLLSGEADSNNAYLEIHAGAGGTEAQDWALLLQRMYLRWAEKKGFKLSYVEESSGDEAGIKSCTLLLENPGNLARAICCEIA